MVDFYPVHEPTYGVSKRENGGYQIKDRPQVNDHIARMVVKHLMNWDAAVSAMMPEAEEHQVKAQVNLLKSRPRVKEALVNLLHSMGLSDQAQKVMIAKMWEVALNPDHKQYGTVLKVFADIFGWAKKSNEGDKPQELPIRDFDKGLQRMFAGESLPGIDSVPDKIEIPDDSDERVN